MRSKKWRSAGISLKSGKIGCSDTVMILSIWTDRSGQTVLTQIRLLLEEQSDQGLHCLLVQLHRFNKVPSGLAYSLEFQMNYSKISGVRKFRNFTVIYLLISVFAMCCQADHLGSL